MSKRTMVTMPVETAVRIHEHRVRGSFKSENAAAVDLIRHGLDRWENRERDREMEQLLKRLRFWGQSVP